jgi:serine/threonine-protein kinase HipA
MDNANCLCCSKPLSESASIKGWHVRCLKRFFGSTSFPEIDLSSDALESLAKESISQGLTVPGVQKKLSLGLRKDSGGISRLTLIDFPTSYILKPESADFPFLPEAEQLVMAMADLTGIPTCPHGLVSLKDGTLTYLTKRIDRTIQKKEVHRIPMEDFCQLSGALTDNKYHGSYEKCAQLIDRYSAQPGLDKSEFFFRLVFCFVTANSDMHLKNFSLIERENGKYVLSPAYDLLPVNVIMPADYEEAALALNGKKSELRKKDFLLFAKTIGVNEKAAMSLLNRVVSFHDDYLQGIESSLLSEELKKRFCGLLKERTQRLL